MTETAPGDDAAVTRALAYALRLDVPERTLSPIQGDLPVVLTEWSVNASGDPRGRLRYGAWTRDAQAVEACVAAFDEPLCAARRAALPRAEMEGLGFAYAGPGAPRFRYWQLASEVDGAELAAAVAAFPALTGPTEALARATGGARRCAAYGWESEAGRPVRETVYFTVLAPPALLAVLATADVAATEGSSRFLRGCLGLGAPAARPFPKVWAGRSVGEGGGLKLYWFVRGEPDRPTDAAILDVFEATPDVREAVEVAHALLGRPAIQLVGLTLRDDAPRGAAPEWTLYLARR